MTGMKSRIEDRLNAVFSPQHLAVSDDSASHAGHAGNPHGRGETHFTVDIVANAFAGKTRVERHRAINQALAEEIAGGIHALALKARAPGE